MNGEFNLNDSQGLFLELVSGCKLMKLIGGVWCTSNKKSHEIAEKLISKGWLIETTTKYFSISGNDRSFELTEKGMEKTIGIQVSEIEPIIDSSI